MRKLALWLAFLLTCSLAFPAVAQDDDWEEDDEEEAGGILEYGSETRNRFLVGLNSLLTWPADFVMDTVQPAEEFDELPLAAVAKYPVGFIQGTMLAIFRASTGTLDVAFAAVTPMRMLSPEPRYMIFAGVEHDEY